MFTCVAAVVVVIVVVAGIFLVVVVATAAGPLFLHTIFMLWLQGFTHTHNTHTVAALVASCVGATSVVSSFLFSSPSLFACCFFQSSERAQFDGGSPAFGLKDPHAAKSFAISQANRLLIGSTLLVAFWGQFKDEPHLKCVLESETRATS